MLRRSENLPTVLATTFSRRPRRPAQRPRRRDHLPREEAPQHFYFRRGHEASVPSGASPSLLSLRALSL